MKARSRQLLEDWKRWAITGPLNQTTATNYHHLLWDFFVEVKWKEPERVSARDVSRWAINLAARGELMPWAGRKALRSFFSYLKVNGFKGPDPSDSMPHKPPSPKVPESFTPVEMAAILKAADDHRDPRVRPTLELLYHTGARRSELCRVKADDISSTHITLYGKASPGGLKKPRSIPLNANSAAAIQQLQTAPRPAAVAGLTNPFATHLVGTGPQGVYDWCQEIGAAVNFRVHPHKFRATFATNLLRAGVDVRIVQQLCGHATLNTTMRYLATTDELLVSAVARLAV